MTTSDLDLLREYGQNHSEEAFEALVNRHLNLVYSAALRQVQSPELAEEVSQSVFTNLARNSEKLAPKTILTAWLYQVARRTAIDVVRREARRHLRDQIAAEMSTMSAADADWTHIEPLLDEAMEALDETDRTAVLLRYFENKSLREVGETLGTSDDAAQKRVSRAVERLREFFAKRGVTVGAGGLALVISANAVQAAPVGFTSAITAAAISGTTIATPATTILTKAIVMTTLEKIVLAAAVAAVIGTGIFAARQNSQLRTQIQALQAQQEPLTLQIQELQKERADYTNRLALLAAENADLKKRPAEVLRLRGEVTRLHQENVSARTNSAFGKIAADPETRKMIRDQQKLGMTIIYADFIKSMNLPKEQADKLKDLLADGVMDNVDQIMAIRRDGKTAAEMNQIFADQNAALLQKVGNLLGPDGLAQYQDYTQNLASHLTARQFEDQLTGDAAAKAEKSKELSQVMQTATQQALASAGLPANYQVVPVLNFSNIASEEQGEQSLQLLNTIYQNVASQAGSFLSPEELTKFNEFATTAVKNNRMALTLNRKMMSPGGN